MDPPPDHGETRYRGSGRLNGRKALITGGDSGMGGAAAIAYAREGADVAINHLPEEEEDARNVIELIRAAGRKGVALPGDIRTEDFCRQLVADAVKHLGGLDILVLNAARQQTRPSIMEVSSEDFDATMKTNVYAPFWTIKAALPHLKPGSAIIGTSSIQAREPAPELTTTHKQRRRYQTGRSRLPSSSGQRVFASMPWPQVPFGRHFKCPVERQWRSSKSSAPRQPSVGLVNLLSLLRSTSNSPPAMQVSPMARFMRRPRA
jgi:hypothetical protein